MVDLYVVLPRVGLRDKSLVKIEIPRGGVWISRLRIHVDDFLADGVDEVGIDDIRECEIRAISVGIDVERVEDMLLNRITKLGRCAKVWIIADHLRVAEISVPFSGSGNESVDVDRVALPGLFEIHKEKRLSFLDWSAKGKAVLIARVVRIWDSLGVPKKFVVVQGRSLAKPPAAAVKLVG